LNWQSVSNMVRNQSYDRPPARKTRLRLPPLATESAPPTRQGLDDKAVTRGWSVEGSSLYRRLWQVVEFTATKRPPHEHTSRVKVSCLEWNVDRVLDFSLRDT
jgi:hypothetical protein